MFGQPDIAGYMKTGRIPWSAYLRRVGMDRFPAKSLLVDHKEEAREKCLEYDVLKTMSSLEVCLWRSQRSESRDATTPHLLQRHRRLVEF